VQQALRKKETQDETQFTTKIGGKTSLGPSYFLFKSISFPVTHLMAYYAETHCSRPLNCLTLWITLIIKRKDFGTRNFSFVDERHSHHVNSYSFFKIDYLSYCTRDQAGFGFISFWFLVSLWLSRMG
jgi:hypothetical protein